MLKRLCVVLCGLLFLASCQKGGNVDIAEEKADFLYNQVIISYLKGDLSASEKGFKEVIQKYPDYMPSYVMLAKTYYFQNNFKESKKYFESSLKKGPNVISYIWLAKIAALDKNEGESFRLLNKALDLDFSNPLTHFELGKYYKRVGKYEKAVYHLNYAISYEDMYPEMKYELATLYVELGAYDMGSKLLKDILVTKNLNEGMRSNIQAMVVKVEAAGKNVKGADTPKVDQSKAGKGKKK